MRFDSLNSAFLDQCMPLGRRADGKEVRWDASLTAMITRELTDVVTQTYDVKYPGLKARQLIPVDNRFNSGAMAYAWRSFDQFTPEATIFEGQADDMPNADVGMSEFTGQFRSLGIAYQYTVQDLRAAAMAGVPLDTKRGNAARRGMENKLEDLAATGYKIGSTTILPGVLTNSDVPLITANGSAYTSSTLTTASGGFGSWIGNTVGNILADVNMLGNNVFVSTKGVHEVDTLVLPTEIYAYLKSTPRSPTFTDDTILQYILKQSPWLKSIEQWNRTDTANAGGTAGRVWAYQKSPENLGLNISQEFEQFAPQVVNMSFKIPCHMRVGGVVYRYPKSAVFFDGAN